MVCKSYFCVFEICFSHILLVGHVETDFYKMPAILTLSKINLEKTCKVSKVLELNARGKE